MASLFSAATQAQNTPPVEVELDTVTVTSTRSARPVHDAPGSVTVIDEERMEKESMRDISDFTRYEPGVSVGGNAGRFGPNSFTIRGIGGNRVLMQVDGIRVPDAFSIGSFSSAGRNVVDIDALKTVEILRGPGSSLYGSDAIGGVVTFLTKDPEDYLRLTDQPWYASVRGGYASADKSGLGTATLAGKRDDLQGMLVFTTRQGSETDNQGGVRGTGGNRTEPNPQGWDGSNFLAKGVYRLDGANRYKLTLEHFRDDTHTDVLTLNPTTPRTTTLTGDDRATRQRVSLEHEHRDADGRYFQVARTQLYYQDSETAQDSFEQRTGTTAGCSGVTAGANVCNFFRSFEFRQRTTGANLQLEKLFDSGRLSHHLVYGADLSQMRTSQLRHGVRHNVTTNVITSNIAPDNFPVRDFPESETTLAGAFAQHEAKLGAWSLIPGLRYDSYKLRPRPDAIFAADNPGIVTVDKEADALSPKLGMLYRATPGLTLFGQYAHGFRAPPYNDVNIGFTNLAFGYTAIPNPDLKPERSRGLEFGVRGRSGRSSFSLAAYHNRYRDFIASLQQLDCPADPRCVGALITFQSVNFTNVTIQGFEARGELALAGGFGLLGAFSAAEGEDTDRRQPVNTIDPPKLVAGLRYDAPGHAWGGQFAGTFVGKKRHVDQTSAPVLRPSPAYSVFDLLAYWNLSKQSSLQFGLFNLTNQKYFLWSDLQGVGAGTAALAGPQSMDRFSQPGRNARASYKYVF